MSHRSRQRLPMARKRRPVLQLLLGRVASVSYRWIPASGTATYVALSRALLQLACFRYWGYEYPLCSSVDVSSVSKLGSRNEQSLAASESCGFPSCAFATANSLLSLCSRLNSPLSTRRYNCQVHRQLHYRSLRSRTIHRRSRKTNVTPDRCQYQAVLISTKTNPFEDLTARRKA